MADRPAILAEGLKKYYGDVKALDGVDLAVPQGTILGQKVRGMNGFDPIDMFEGGEIYRTKDA